MTKEGLENTLDSDVDISYAMRLIHDELSQYSPRELAEYIASAPSHEAQFLYLTYAAMQTPEFQNEVRTYLDKLNKHPTERRQPHRRHLEDEDYGEDCMFI